MDKLNMSTPDLTDKNIEQIGNLFPHVITETRDETGKVIKAVDFDLLKQTLSKQLVEDDTERYRLDWPGKKASILKANTPITKTLRPCREESVNFDTTENLYIEGDNFEVLKILQESCLGKVKMIYIDPPYNTGNDFIYKDNFTKSKDEYEEELGITNEEGGRLFKNTDTNGRYHSDWLSMMYERLIVARDLLKDDGVIFISIDDNEVHNLRKICDEIFGEDNFVANFIWEKRVTRENRKAVSNRHDHIICYIKSSFTAERTVGLLPMNEEAIERYKNPDNDPRGDWTSVPAIAQAGHGTKSQFYTLITPASRKIDPPSGSCWRYTREKMNEAIAENRIWFGSDGKGVPRIKKFLTEGQQGLTVESIWWAKEIGTNDTAKRELTKLFNGIAVFDTPKPDTLLDRILRIGADKQCIIMDFFSGSAPTAHAVMQLNAEDGGNRKFIMVQLPEKCEETSEAFKAGYKTIVEIGKERIRRAGKKILEENKDKEGIDNLDIGFRVYKTDSSNMKDVFYHPSELNQDQLSFLESNIKEDRTPEDLLTQVILDLGLELTLPIETKQILGNTVFLVQTNALLACFDDNIDFAIVDTIADLKPLKVVFKDASFKDDMDRINLEERFKRLSPETRVAVI